MLFELYLSLSLDAASQVLEKHEEEFFEVVDAKLNLLRLKRKKVITESLVTEIKSADSANARERERESYSSHNTHHEQKQTT